MSVSYPKSQHHKKNTPSRRTQKDTQKNIIKGLYASHRTAKHYSNYTVSKRHHGLWNLSLEVISQDNGPITGNEYLDNQTL